MGTIRENKEILRLFIVEGLAGDMTLIDELTSPAFVFHDHDGTSAAGADGFKRDAADLTNAFPDLSFHMEDLVAEGDMVAGRFVMTGRSERSYRGVPPSGDRVQTTGLALARIDGRRVAEAWLRFDLVEALCRVPVA